MFTLEKYYPEGFDIKQHWDEKYAQMFQAGKDPEEYRAQKFWPTLQALLEKNKRYLDVGCGVGGWSLFLQDEGYGTAGIDTARRTIQAITEYDPDAEVKVAAPTAIPYADASFDGVIAIGTLEYIQDNVPKALQEIHRVLKPEGFIFLEVSAISLLRQLIYIPLKQWQAVNKKQSKEKATFAHYLFSRADIAQLLTEAGFAVTDMQPHDLPEATSHYGLYTDWPFLRGAKPYQLNALGRIVKAIGNVISPWTIATGMIVVAKKD